eukprot:COSAG01_NODE_6642_length_3566_cov_255.360831_4_plen_79_part_00
MYWSRLRVQIFVLTQSTSSIITTGAQGKFPDVNQNSDSEGFQTGDRLEIPEFHEIAEICKTGIRQLLGSPYDSGRNSC